MEKQQLKEPEDQPYAEQTDCLSLIISGEEETTEESTDFGVPLGDEDGRITNGHSPEEEQKERGPQPASPHTSYWSVSDDPDTPFLLSPIPAPPHHKSTSPPSLALGSPNATPQVQGPPPARPARASRTGLSRIPGRDHRRYYHEYWRSEYLMDFDPRRHGMICMVCGSSLATLKLSTIKRHIRQKHPDSLLWSAADKELIRQGWESHLGLEASHQPFIYPSGGEGEGMARGEQGKEEEPGDGGSKMEITASEEMPGYTQEPTAAMATTSTPLKQTPPSSNSNQVVAPTSLSSPVAPVTTATSSSSLSFISPTKYEQEVVEEEEEQQQGQGEVHAEELHAQTGTQAEGAQQPSAHTLERYLNDSLHAWFRQEFLMDYQAEVGQLVCMVCGGAPLPSLHLETIKRHVLDLHPNSLVYSSEEKHCILQSWAQAHESESSPLPEYFKQDPDAKDPSNTNLPAQTSTDCGTSCMDFLSDEMDSYMSPIPPDSLLHLSGDSRANATSCSPQSLHTAPSQAPLAPPSPPLSLSLRPSPPSVSPPLPPSSTANLSPLWSPLHSKRLLREGFPWRLRLDYMVAYGPQGAGCYCMVCWQPLAAAKVSCFRLHIQESHPDTTRLSRREREQMADAWVRDAPPSGSTQHDDSTDKTDLFTVSKSDGGGNHLTSPKKSSGQTKSRSQDSVSPKGTALRAKNGPASSSGDPASSSSSSTGRHGHYPGKDQRRNYQVRWRTDFLMDYDCRRHGLICMVCGATLATLKVSTIKRHIQQVHPASLAYGPEEQQRTLTNYMLTAPRCTHSEDCYSATSATVSQDLGLAGTAVGAAVGAAAAEVAATVTAAHASLFVT